jgi:Asp-tRNA(Asn)/Glu-tRNA(Gln) amidotransferase A subunit family amidase
MLTPSAPTPPVTITSSLRGESPIDAYVNDVMTVPASLARLPALALPITTTNIDVLGSLIEVCCVCCVVYVCPTTYPFF